MATTRTEKDSMGAMEVPLDAYYGAQTERARCNFQISSLRFPRAFIRAIGLVKKAAAQVNMDLNLLPTELGEAIVQAAQAVADGQHDDQFVLDVFQTGSGTSTNMNTNEVIAGIANEQFNPDVRGGKSPVHPNDAVNMGQSSNDVIPTAIHVAALEGIQKRLLPALEALAAALDERARAFDPVVKIGRTHLQDAVPIRLGQEFSGYAAQVAHGVRRLKGCAESLGELAIGGTALGTGINTHAEFSKRMTAKLGQDTGLEFRPAGNHFEAMANRDAAVETSGALKTVAISLSNIANNIRWLASGPRCGIGEVRIPELQPGSSIMPAKVNPVIPEAVMMVAAQVVGNDATIAWANALGSNFDLNVMMPVIAYNLLQSIEILTNAAQHLTEKCVDASRFLEGQKVDGVLRIEADEARCGEMIERSLAMCTALAPRIGYDNASAVAKKAYHDGVNVRAVAEGLVGKSAAEIEAVLGPPCSAKVLESKGGFPTLDEITRLLEPHGQTVRGTGGGRLGGRLITSRFFDRSDAGQGRSVGTRFQESVSDDRWKRFFAAGGRGGADPRDRRPAPAPVIVIENRNRGLAARLMPPALILFAALAISSYQRKTPVWPTGPRPVGRGRRPCPLMRGTRAERSVPRPLRLEPVRRPKPAPLPATPQVDPGPARTRRRRGRDSQTVRPQGAPAVPVRDEARTPSRALPVRPRPGRRPPPVTPAGAPDSRLRSPRPAPCRGLVEAEARDDQNDPSKRRSVPAPGRERKPAAAPGRPGTLQRGDPPRHRARGRAEGRQPSGPRRAQDERPAGAPERGALQGRHGAGPLP